MKKNHFKSLFLLTCLATSALSSNAFADYANRRHDHGRRDDNYMYCRAAANDFFYRKAADGTNEASANAELFCDNGEDLRCVQEQTQSIRRYTGLSTSESVAKARIECARQAQNKELESYLTCFPDARRFFYVKTRDSKVEAINDADSFCVMKGDLNCVSEISERIFNSTSFSHEQSIAIARERCNDRRSDGHREERRDEDRRDDHRDEDRRDRDHRDDNNRGRVPPQRVITLSCTVNRLDPAGMIVQLYTESASGYSSSDVQAEACRKAMNNCSSELRGRQSCR